jgi:hypothetical protein
MVRGHGRGGTISRDCRMICYASCMHCMRSIVHKIYHASRLLLRTAYNLSCWCRTGREIFDKVCLSGGRIPRLYEISRQTSDKQLPGQQGSLGGAAMSLIHIEFQYSMPDTFVPYTPMLTHI